MVKVVDFSVKTKRVLGARYIGFEILTDVHDYNIHVLIEDHRLCCESYGLKIALGEQHITVDCSANDRKKNIEKINALRTNTGFRWL